MRLTSLLISTIAICVPVMADSIKYQLSFVGSYYLDGSQQFISSAPSSGSFSYSPTSGFSDFLVNYYTTFDLTSYANSPEICNLPSPCVSATPAQEFAALMSNHNWETHNIYEDGGLQAVFSMPGIAAYEDPIPNFGFPGPNPIVGTFSVTETPEPSNFGLMVIVLLGAIVFFRSQKPAANENRTPSSFS